MNHQFKLYFSVLFLISGLFSSCESTPKESPEDIKKRTENLVKHSDSILRNVQMQWAEMEHADEALLENTKILADTIATLEGLNQPLYDSISIFIEEAKAQKYDQETMSNSDQIDKFDALITRVVNGVTRLQETTEGSKDCVVCDGILTVIKDIDNSYVIRRKKYDREADLFNQFVKENKEILDGLDAEKYKKLPLFSFEN